MVLHFQFVSFVFFCFLQVVSFCIRVCVDISIWFVYKGCGKSIHIQQLPVFLDMPIKELVIHIVIEFHLFAVALSANINT